jgi:hypothetical protein
VTVLQSGESKARQLFRVFLGRAGLGPLLWYVLGLTQAPEGFLTAALRGLEE